MREKRSRRKGGKREETKKEGKKERGKLMKKKEGRTGIMKIGERKNRKEVRGKGEEESK